MELRCLRLIPSLAIGTVSVRACLMARKKQVIGKDGQLKTIVRAERSRQDRIEQHMHGRSDHIRVDDRGLKYAVYAFVSILVMGILVLFLWLAIGR